MGLGEAKRYIHELHRRQVNPYLWPDFLTGLPDRAAIIEKILEIYPKLGKHSISYIRIANIHPYLIKYGSDRHAELIQWAAAVLKTTSDKYKGFVGAFGTHDFIAICRAKSTNDFLKETGRLFEKKAKTFYSKEDIERKKVLSFTREGKKINIGFMKLIASTVDKKTVIRREDIIPYLGKLCSELERA